jgi:signal transduction histidine kinase
MGKRTPDQIRDDDASNRDRTAADRDRAADLRDRGAEDRDVLARQHEEAASDRDQVASDQARTWSDDDRAASGRDQLSADLDQRAADEDFAAGGDAVTHRRGLLAREQSRRDRGTVSASRDETAAARRRTDAADTRTEDFHRRAESDRVDAAGDRGEAADDRAEAADDRERAARQRIESLRNRSESTLAAQRAVETLESMNEAFFTLDSEWRFTYLNPQTEAMLERRRGDLVGKVVWDEFPDAVGSTSDEEYRRAIRDQVPVRFEHAYEPLGRAFQVRAYPVTGGLAVYFTDITSERRQDARTAQAQRLEAIGRVTAGIAHDFNNLLTGIGGFATLGRNAAVDETTTGYFEQIESARQTATALTRQLLAFAREQVLEPVVIDLNHVAKGLVPLMRQLMPAGIDLQLVLSQHPVPVFVDRSQLEQVVLNLVVNGRDAIDGIGTITISTTTGKPAGLTRNPDVPSGLLLVSDTGSGIAADVRPLIFDPFFSTKPHETGTGLGLATIHEIVSQSGGSIIVDSTVGAGTTMTVVLPADQPR